METIKLQLEPLTCPSCIKKIESSVGKMEGVEEAKVLFNSSKVKATIDTSRVSKEQIAQTIEKLGYEVVH